MCGIVAAVAGSNIVPVFVEGLKKYEYLGEDDIVHFDDRYGRV